MIWFSYWVEGLRVRRSTRGWALEDGQGQAEAARAQAGAPRAATKRNRATDLFARARVHDFSSRTTHNKFDIKDNKRAKHVVLGRKVKALARRFPSSTRDKLSSKTLLPAMNRAGKANTFLDRRIGEQDETMNQEERDLQRFIRARERFRGGEAEEEQQVQSRRRRRRGQTLSRTEENPSTSSILDDTSGRTATAAMKTCWETRS